MSDDVLRAVKMTFVHDIKQSHGLSAIANFFVSNAFKMGQIQDHNYLQQASLVP